MKGRQDLQPLSPRCRNPSFGLDSHEARPRFSYFGLEIDHLERGGEAGLVERNTIGKTASAGGVMRQMSGESTTMLARNIVTAHLGGIGPIPGIGHHFQSACQRRDCTSRPIRARRSFLRSHGIRPFRPSFPSQGSGGARSRAACRQISAGERHRRYRSRRRGDRTCHRLGWP